MHSGLFICSLLPLYALMGLGYIARRFLQADQKTFSNILIFIISPVVVFRGVALAHITPAYLMLPFAFYVVGCVLAVAFYYIGGLCMPGGRRNILAALAGTGNIGYFGLPLVSLLLGQDAFNIAVIITLGPILYGNTIAYYYFARGNFSAKKSLYKVLCMPALYAFLCGLAAQVLHWRPEGALADAMSYFNGAYILLGMMAVGMGLAGMTRGTLDPLFISLTFITKFVLYPAIIALLVWLDSNVTHLFTSTTYKAALLIAITPLASNMVAYAITFNLHPHKTSLTVLLSTLFALLYIPVFVMLFIH